MKIELDQEVIDVAINKTATKAIAEALSGYSVTSSIAEVVTNQVATGAIAEAIRKAVEDVDTAKLTQHLAAEMQRATAKAVVNVLQEGLLSIVCKIRGIGDYSDDDKKERARLKEELFNKH